MPDVAMIIAQEIFRDEEYAEPRQVLESRGASVTTASVSAGECIGKLGMRATADVALHDISTRPWDAVLFIGGAGAQVFFDDPDAHRLARGTLDAGGVVGAICIAPSTLAHAGMLDGRSATAFASQEADLRAHGARWTGDPVTVDGRVVTANGPAAATAFGEAVAELLGIQDGKADRMRFMRCRICGDTYLGVEAPSRCPFCGADRRYFVDPGGFSAAENDVQLTEMERRGIERAIEIERSNSRFYAAVALLPDDEALASGYKRLSRVEAEHCSVFCTLAGLRKPVDLSEPSETPATWCEAIAESARRESEANAFYAELAERATNPRVREVVSAVAEVESDHLALDAEASRLAGC